MVRLAAPPEKTAEFPVHCADCRHRWVAFYLPMRLSLIHHFANIACPQCGSKVVMAGEPKVKP